MKMQMTALIENKGLTRRQLMVLGVVGLAGWTCSPVRVALAALQDDLKRLTHIPQMAEREGPMLVFRDFVADPDVEVEHHIRLQLAQRKDLLDRVRKKIGSEKEVRLSMEDIQVRLMFVPQLKEEHAVAYHRYCIDITDYFFSMNQTNNFYAAITSPHLSYPPLSQTGVSAFLVHRLAKDYRAVCRFTAESGRSLKYMVSGAIYSNHLGAVDLEIEMLAPGQFRLTRKPYTIWQNNTDNLYTLMSVPLEETLHYQMGKYTDREIGASMKNHPPKNLFAAQRLAEEWMAVEESVVGGLVSHVLERYCRQHHMGIPALVPGKMQLVVPSLHQYRYRARGIQLVKALGFETAMTMYMESPSAFKDQLVRQQDAWSTARQQGRFDYSPKDG